jgi:hypothetical protein
VPTGGSVFRFARPLVFTGQIRFQGRALEFVLALKFLPIRVFGFAAGFFVPLKRTSQGSCVAFLREILLNGAALCGFLA